MRGTSLLCVTLLAAFASTVNSQCTQTVIPVNNRHVSGGTLTPGQATMAACQATCFANTACKAFDWTSSTASCWLLITPTNLTPEPETGTTHNRVSYTCTANCNYVSMGQNKPTATVTGTVVADMNTCLVSCNANAACLGITYTASTTTCQIITSTTTFTAMTPDANTVTYRVLANSNDIYQALTGTNRATCNPTRAAALAGCSYAATPNVHSTGGVPQTGVLSSGECGVKCYGITGCLAYDWAPTEPRCWTFSGNTRPATTTATGITHYACAQTAIACYTSTSNTHRQNGSPQTGVTTQPACEALCSAAATCLAYDFNSGATPPCWVHNVAGATSTDTGTTAYLKVSCTTPTCTPTYTRSPGFHAQGSAGPAPNIANEAACQAACSAQGSTCTGADWVSSGQCWLHTNAITAANTAPEANTVLLVADWTTCTGATTPTPAVGPTTSAPTPATGCTSTFAPRTGVHGIGGVANTVGTSESLCRTQCTTTGQTCVGYDWIPGSAVGRRCWLHTGTAQPNMGNQNGATYYAATWICGGASASTIAPTAATTAPTGCVVQFKEYKGEHGVGTPSATAAGTTKVLCEALCVKDTACLGYDWVHVSAFNANDRCWLHTAQTTINNKQSSSIINLYVVTSRTCPCAPKYTITQDVHAIGANAPLASATTVAACETSCTTNTNCVGYDWNGNTGVAANTRCWIHINAADINNIKNATGFSFHQIDRTSCTTGSSTSGVGTTTPPCVPTFAATANTHGLGVASSTTAGTTQTLCQNICINQKSCTAYDFDTTTDTPVTQKCWIHTAASPITAPGEGITFYKIDRTCTGVTTVPSCQPTWTVMNDKNANGSPGPTASATTLALCRAACIANPACIAVDFDARTLTAAAQRCWLHTNAADLNQIKTLTSVSLHTLKRDCATTPAPCPPSFSEEKNKHARGAAAFPGAATAAQCKSQCISQANCVALDFDTRNKTDNTQRCWVHTTAMFTNNLVEGEGLNFYRIDRTCTATTLAPATPTPTQGCQPTFTVSTNHKAVGAPGPTTSATSLNLCRAACTATAGCVGLDYDNTIGVANSMRCWLHTNINDQVVPVANIDHHRITRTCEVCVPSYEVLTDKKAVGSPGATQSATTNTACAAACTALSTCVGYDFNYIQIKDPSKRCWLHTNPSDSIVNAAGLNHYKINRNCATTTSSTTTTTTSSACPVTFTKIPLSHAIGASGPTASGSTSNLCGQACVAMASCVGYDFVFTGASAAQRCWLHTNTNDLNSISPDQSADFYRIDRSCVKTTPGPVPTNPPTGCQFDIAILVDSSGSIRDYDSPNQNSWVTVKNWLRNIVTDIGSNMNLNGIRLSVITFSNYAQVRWDLDDKPTVSAQLSAIDSLSYAGGSTNTGLAFVKAYENVFTSQGGDRAGVPNILVLMTDGETTLEQSSLVTRRRTLQTNVPGDYYAIGVTNRVDNNELLQFAKGTAGNMFQVNQFDSLISTLVTSKLRGCNIAPVPTPAPTAGPINTRRPLV